MLKLLGVEGLGCCGSKGVHGILGLWAGLGLKLVFCFESTTREPSAPDHPPSPGYSNTAVMSVRADHIATMRAPGICCSVCFVLVATSLAEHDYCYCF